MSIGEKGHGGGAANGVHKAHVEDGGEGNKLGRTEAVMLPDFCPNCQKPGQLVNCITDIPFFKVPLRATGPGCSLGCAFLTDALHVR
eukprot:15619-Eustigmatos_ZCMA.PRE.1